MIIGIYCSFVIKCVESKGMLLKCSLLLDNRFVNASHYMLLSQMHVIRQTHSAFRDGAVFVKHAVHIFDYIIAILIVFLLIVQP